MYQNFWRQSNCSLFIKAKELKIILYAAVVSLALYFYIMQYIREETQRVSHLGFACIVFTVTMQASPLAAVVSKMSLIVMLLYVSQNRVLNNPEMLFVEVCWNKFSFYADQTVMCFEVTLDSMNNKHQNVQNIVTRISNFPARCHLGMYDY